jgi:putative phosphoesterase
VWDDVASADAVIHAGDWVDVRLFDELEARSKRLIGVHGNNDSPDLRRRLPEIARVTLAGVRVAVVHETGPAKGREARCAAAFPDCDLLVFGHSHIPWDSCAGTGLRLLNPGSPTDRRRQPAATYQVVSLRDGRIEQVDLVSLPPRVPQAKVRG